MDELIAELKAEHKGYPEFFEKFCSYDSINTPRQVMETMLYGTTKEQLHFKVEKTKPTGKKKVFIFIKGLRRDFYSEQLIENINSIDLKKFDVYLCMKANNVKKYSSMLSRLNKEINYFPINFNINYTKMDYILSKLSLKFGINLGFINERIDKIMEREIRKYFGDAEFDIVIHHSKLDRMIGNMCRLLGKTTVYNFKYFNYEKYKESRAYRKQVKYFIKRFPAYSNVVATTEFDLLKKKADNIVYNEEAQFPMTKILSEVTQHEGRSRNIS